MYSDDMEYELKDPFLISVSGSNFHFNVVPDCWPDLHLIVLPDVPAVPLAFLLRVREVLGSCLGPKTGNTD
jgi:hypothetical protein